MTCIFTRLLSMTSIAAIALGACAQDVPATPHGTLDIKQARIVGGSAESGFAAVGALVDGSGAFCTGTLVAPKTVVTAAHCFGGSANAAGLSFFVGPNANRAGSGSAVTVASVHAHPQYDGDVGNDIAVLKLTAAPPVTPIPYLAQPMDNTWVGKAAVFVGYGVTSADSDDAGVKRSVVIDISGVMDNAFEYRSPNKNTCFGDSGGPALAQVGGQFHLLGVTSYGDSDCAEYGVNTRVDSYQDFVAGLLGDDVTPPASVPGDDTGPDAGSDDICAVQGWYGDGICDIGCASPDPDCGGETPDSPLPGPSDGDDVCAAEGWYGDGICDIGCANPDPDCEGMDDFGDIGDWSDADDGHDQGACDHDGPVEWDDDGDDDFGDDDWGDDTDDICAAEGWYGDGICDDGCANPDPDCQE